jgi:hypothetical protein
MSSYTIDYNTFITNKNYFDEKLINLLQRLYSRNVILSKLVDNKAEFKQRQALAIKSLNFQLKDSKIKYKNLLVSFENKDRDLKKTIKDFEREINKTNKRINDELSRSYKRENEALDKLDEANRRIKELEDILKKMSPTKKDSSNSSLPPSLDINKPVSNSRVKSHRAIGGQKGHKANISKLDNNPSDVIEVNVVKAPAGAIAVYNEKNEVEYYKTQEIDAKLVTKIIETRYYIKEDGVALDKATISKYKINPVTYTNAFKSLVIYLNSKGTIPLDRLCIILSELSNSKITLKPGTIPLWQAEFASKSEPKRLEILKSLLDSGIIHIDESGWRINGKRSWLHVMANNDYAYFEATIKRSDVSNNSLEKLNSFKGYLVHDHFKAYYTLEDCTHVECNAHILRYLLNGVDVHDNIACAKLRGLFQSMLHERKELINKGVYSLSEEKITSFKTEYHKIIDDELERYESENPSILKKYIPDYIPLFKRLKEYEEQHLLFLIDFAVPFDNNLAERQIRQAKTKKKVSGQSKSLKTANYYAAILTINQTCILQKKNTLKEIESIFNLS